MDNSKCDAFFKIGEVARMNRISTDTLRFYDEIDLFKADIIEENGYRYYKPQSLVNLDLILWLRWNGMSIEDIKAIMEGKNLNITISKFKSEIEKSKNTIKLMEDRICTFNYYIDAYKAFKKYGLEKCHMKDFNERISFPMIVRFRLTTMQAMNWV